MRHFPYSLLAVLWATRGLLTGGELELGPMLGHVDAGSARVWVKAGSESTARLKVGKGEAMEEAREGSEVRLEAGHDFTGTLAIDGLAPETDYRYEVVLDGEVAASARSRGEVDFILLDARYHRSPDKAPEDGAKSLLGARQLAWLKETLKASEAKVKFVAAGSEWQMSGHLDSWTSYARERAEILDFIRDEKIEGVVLLSGDRHFTAGYQVRGI